MNKLKRVLCTVLALTILLFLFSGCGSGQENDAVDEDVPYEGETPLDTIVLNDGVFSLCYDDKKGINPISGAAPDNMLFNSLMFDYVYKLTKDNMPYSEIVTEYTTNDFSWWVFDIAEDVYFSDGSLLTAKDVVYSIVQAMMSDVHGTNLSNINGISAMGSNCFAVSLREADAMLPNLLTVPIVKRELGEEDAYHLGSGAYMLSEDGTQLVVNPYSRYKDSLPAEYINLVTYDDITEKISAFESGKVDLVLNDPSSMYNLGYGSSNEVRYADTMNMHFVGFNVESNYFMTAAARHAFNYIIDRDTIVSKCLDSNGVKTCFPCHPNDYLYDKEYAEEIYFDKEKFYELLEEGGYKDYDSDGYLECLVTGIVVEINVKIIVNTDSTQKVSAAKRICEDLNNAGIKAYVTELGYDEYISCLNKGAYDMFYGEMMVPADRDISDFFKPYKKTAETDKGLNYFNLFDNKYDELYKAYRKTQESERKIAFKEAGRYVMDTGAIVPICFEKRQVLTHRGTCAGVEVVWTDVFRNYSQWTLDP